MTPDMVLAILKKIASSTHRGRLGLALIDEVCRPYNLSDADVSRVKKTSRRARLRYQRLSRDCGDNGGGDQSR